MTLVLRSDDMRRHNRLRIIQIVRRERAISRSAIAQMASLSPATVSTISNDLIAEGVLISRDSDAAPAAGRGRPSIMLSLNPVFRHAVLLILKIGVVTVAVVDYSGAVVARQEFDLDTAGISRSGFRKQLIDAVRRTWEATGLEENRLARISVGVQGTTDIGGSRMLWSPMIPLTDLPIGEWLEDAFKAPVRVSNDCDLIAKALNWRDPDRYNDNFAAILLAHGVGMGLFLRGRIVNGTRSSGTEFGHMMFMPGGALCRCGSRGCIEAYSGDYAIARKYRGHPDHAEPLPHIDPEEINPIADAARSGDEAARDIFAAAGRALGSGLAGMFALVDPFRVVFVGHGALAFDLKEPALRETLKNANATAAEDIPIDLFPDEMPLVLEGCGIDALSEIDADQTVKISETLKV